MSTVNQRETRTQAAVVCFFTDTLGYRYLGNWKNRSNKTKETKRGMTQALLSGSMRLSVDAKQHE